MSADFRATRYRRKNPAFQPGFSLRQKPSLALQCEIVRQSEANDGLGGDVEVSVAGEGCSGCACARTCCSADQRALAAAGEAADERAEAGAATDEPTGAFALALLGAHHVTRGERIALAVERERGEAEV